MSNKNSIRSIPSVEVASSSDTNAPVFYFNQYNQSQEYFNNRERIDFVTYEGSLYVPGAERVVPQTNDITRENFVLLVSRGPQGLPGIKGDPGRDGRTPSVFARFDGKQMIFYTNELNEDGTQKINERTREPVIKRIAATNDLTGPSWRPKRVDDTIIWEKTRDDSQPESINLSDFVKETAPVIFRVDSDNTKRTDETSGPANYIQWKYEGDEYWNNLISISELMNLALAGVCIWFDETDQEYHLGHRQVLHATYDSSKSGKRIISDVEHGDVLYDAGPIHLPDFEADIAALWEEVCALKDRVDAIEEELPKFVKAVIINDKLNKPDEDGVVDLGAFDFYTKEESDEKFQPAGDYIKKSDLKFEVRNEEGGRFLYVSFENGAPGTWTKIYEATCVCKKEEDPTVYYTIFFETPTPSTATMTYSGTVKYPESQVRVPAGTTVVLEADAEGYKHYKETKLINADYHFAPVLTEESAPEVKYGACVIDDTNLADRIYIGTTSANKQQACLENLSNGTTVYGKATRSGYKDKTVSGVINNDDLEFHITGEWESSSISVTGVSINDGKNYTMCLSDAITHTFKATVTPSSATNKSVKWRSVNPEYLTINETTGLATPKKTTDTLSTGYVTVIARTDDGGHEAECKVVIEDCSEPDPETTLSVNPSSLTFDKNKGNETFTVITNVDDYNVEPECDWITFTKSEKTVTINVSANTGSARTCNVKVTAGDKEVSVSVSQDSGEVVPTPTYTVTATAASCDPAITVVELSTSKDGPFTSDGLLFDKGTEHDVWVKATRTGHEDRLIKYTVSETNSTLIVPCDGWTKEKYSLTINSSNTPSGYSINVGTDAVTLIDNTWEKQYEYGTEIVITAEASGYTSTINPNNFNMTKETSVNINWTKNDPELYTVNTSISGGSCSSSDKPDTLTISKTQNGTYGSSLTFNEGSGNHTIYVKATKNRKVNKTWTETVNGATTITLDSSDDPGCSWENETVPCSVSGVTVRPSTLTLTERQTSTLSKTVNSTGTCENTVTWSSTDASVATVDQTGKVTAVSAGTATIKATSDDNENKVGQCAVTVNAPTTNSYIKVNNNTEHTTFAIEADAPDMIYGNIAPNDTTGCKELPESTDLVISYSSSTLGSPSSYKVKVGSWTSESFDSNITIPYRNISGGTSCDNVVNINIIDFDTTVPVTSVVMNCHEGSIVVGDQITLSATVYPANATDKTITWVQGQNPKGTISGNTFTATSSGIALIHAEAGGVSSNECGITIDPRPVSVEGISIDNCPGTIAQGLTNVYLTATIDPSDATNKNVTWSSSNSNIVAVEKTNDGRGHLIVKNTAGTATITVTTEDGNYTSSCTIVVPSAAIEFALGNQTSSGNKIYYTIGDNIDENEWSETWDSLNYGATTGTNPPLTISPGESLCITSENYPEDIQLEVNGTNRDDTNGFITMTYSELQQAAGYPNTYIVTFVREH